MKQSEKLDVMLRYLYERKDDNKEYSIADILASSGIDTNPTEVARLAEHLEKDKYIVSTRASTSLHEGSLCFAL